MVQLVVMTLLVSACGAVPASDPTVAVDSGAGSDALVPAAIDSGLFDAGTPADASALDAGTDASDPDSGSCVCTPASECRMGECVDGACVDTFSPDGTTCGEMGLEVCVEGACVTRGCGDGYREPGASTMREACDDGNTSDGDACSSTCFPTPLTLAYDPAGLEEPVVTRQGAAVGIDGSGAVLVVWGEGFGDMGRVRAQRLTGGGVPMGAPFDVDPSHASVNTAEVTTAGLAGGGWVVVWEADRSGSRDIVYRMIDEVATVGGERVANSVRDGLQHEARVAAVGDGFVIVWTDANARPDDALGGVRARIFAASGSAVGGEMFVATDRSQREDRPQIASSGTRWSVTWHRSMLTTLGSVQVMLRRYDGATARDSGPMQAVPDGGRSAVVAALEDGNWAIAWWDGADVYARLMDDAAPALRMEDVLSVATRSDTVEARPAISALGEHGFLVAWEEGSPAHIEFAADPGTALAPEATMLAMELEGLGGWPPPSITASPDGVWFAWGSYTFGTPARALGVFHLPRD